MKTKEYVFENSAQITRAWECHLDAQVEVATRGAAEGKRWFAKNRADLESFFARLHQVCLEAGMEGQPPDFVFGVNRRAGGVFVLPQKEGDGTWKVTLKGDVAEVTGGGGEQTHKALTSLLREDLLSTEVVSGHGYIAGKNEVGYYHLVHKFPTGKEAE